MRFQVVVVGRGGGGRGPQDGVVIGEEGEDDAQEEGDGCFGVLLEWLFWEGCGLGSDGGFAYDTRSGRSRRARS